MHVSAQILQIGTLDRYLDKVVDRAYMWADSVEVQTVPWEMPAQGFLPTFRDTTTVGIMATEVVLEAEAVRSYIEAFPHEYLAWKVYFMMDKYRYIKTGILGPHTTERVVPASGNRQIMASFWGWLPEHGVVTHGRTVDIASIDYAFAHPDDRKLLIEKLDLVIPFHESAGEPWYRGGLLG